MQVQRQELDGLKAEHIALLANSEAAELQRQVGLISKKSSAKRERISNGHDIWTAAGQR